LIALTLFTLIVFFAARTIAERSFERAQNNSSAVLEHIRPFGLVRVGKPGEVMAAVAPASAPVGGGAGRLFKLGNQPINARIEAYYNVIRPDGAPDWTLSFQWQFLFPK